MLADALGDAARVMRVLEDWTAVRLWLIVTLVAGCGAAEVTEPVFALVGWGVGGLAAVVLVAVQAWLGR